jgi:hypothetical protein
MNSQPEYHYTILPNSRSIRLIQLKAFPALFPLLQCNLVTVSIDELPAFEALSYVWGNPALSSEILISNAPLYITANCFDALKNLAPKLSDDKERLLWVDSICINQRDMSERNSQVSLMAEIYGGAERVVVWLGEGSKENDEVIEKLHVLQKHYGNESIDEVTRAKCEFP